MIGPARPLTAAQERFCIEYVATGNRAVAARAAYPAVANDSQAASERGRRLMRRPHVLARIAALGAVPERTPPPDTSELERVAMIAFSDGVSDLVRLIALRTVSDGLRRWQAAYCGSAFTSRIVVQLRLDIAEPVATPK